MTADPVTKVTCSLAPWMHQWESDERRAHAARREDRPRRPVSSVSPPAAPRIVSHQLAILVAEALVKDAAALGSHWERQARSVAPRLHGPAGTEATGEEPREMPRGERLVRAVATALSRVAGGQQELVRAGWELGAGSHGGEQSLHYLLKELNLLSAMLLYACEQALAGEAGNAALAQDGRAPTAAEGMAIARRVQRSVSLLTLAASKGFTHDYLSGMVDHFRMLRHDLRNPLGTIRSAITLMEDQSVEPEMRNHPRFRAMVVRNASNLDRLIGGQLSDDSVLDSALSRQAVSLYEVALAVRRELRDEADASACTIEVDESLPERELDPVGVELALRTLVSEALSVAAKGDRVRIGFDGTSAGTLCVLVTVEGDRRPGADDLLPPSLLEEVAKWSGGGKAVGTRSRVQLAFPAIDADAPEKANDTAPLQPPVSPSSSSPRDQPSQPSA
jgi:signal transduction histidine kinase